MPGILLLVLGALGGAGIMHLIDRRRLRDGDHAADAESVLSSDATGALTAQQARDAQLAGLIEEDIRHLFTHPAAIRITARDGVVTLAGPVMADEHTRLLAHVRSFRGVRGVKDQLRPQTQRGDLPDVQSGSHVHSDEGI